MKMLGLGAATKIEVTNSEKTFADFMKNLKAAKDGLDEEVSGEVSEEQ